MSELRQLTGMRFGYLVVVDRSSNDHKGRTKWRCACDCGNTTTVLSANLTRSNTRSCGCLTAKVAARLSTKHSMCRTETYKSWQSMKSRCYNPKSDNYKYYGGRGIGVCLEWLDSFSAFHADMGDRPEGMSIDRIDNDGHYCQANCKWSTRKEQRNNRRDNIDS